MFQRPNFQKFVRFPFNNYNSENKKGKIIRTIKRPLKLKIKNSYCLKDLEHHCKSCCKKALSFFNHRMCSVKKGVLRNFAKFTGKHLCQSLFFYKVACLRLAQVFSCEFCEISKNTISTEHLQTPASKLFPFILF